MIGMMVGSAAGGPLAAISYQHCMIFLGVVMTSFAPINFFIRVSHHKSWVILEVLEKLLVCADLCLYCKNEALDAYVSQQ